MNNTAKKTAVIASLVAAVAVPAAIGGEPVVVNTKQPPVFTPPPPPASFGEGLYFALHGGVNAYQSYEGTVRGHTVGGRSAALEVREKVGGFGGIKFGYGWGGDTVKPALEFDGFYNGVDFAVDGRLNGEKLGSATGRFDTGAFLMNGLLRFDTNTQFMPYIGAGAGTWIGQMEDFRLATSSGRNSVSVGSNDTTFAFAWQLMAGADYFFRPNASFFVEYKYLNYEETDFGASSHRTAQHLVGVGLRWFY